MSVSPHFACGGGFCLCSEDVDLVALSVQDLLLSEKEVGKKSCRIQPEALECIIPKNFGMILFGEQGDICLVSKKYRADARRYS